MNRVSQYLITLVALLTISFSQSNINRQKPLTQQIHDNIHKSLIINQFSEGARPTEEIIQVWSEDINDWENSERYTYEYNPAKSTLSSAPGLNKTTLWGWDSQQNVWSCTYYWDYVWNDDGTQQSWTQYDANDAPLYMNEYTGPFYNGYVTSETYYSYTGGAWSLHTLTERTFNSYGFPTQTDYTYNNPETPSSRTTTEYDPTYTQWGCPQTRTWYTNTNGWVQLWEERCTYGQSSCVNDPVPYIIWDRYRCNQTQEDLYSYDATTDTWVFYIYNVYSIDSGTCLTTMQTGYNPSGDAMGRYYFWYWTPSGGFPKTSTAYDNSESRLTRFESELYIDTEWEKSQRIWYSYEGIQMDTEDNSIIHTIFELKQNFPNPFNPSTSIIYNVSEESLVNIIIYDLMGNEIKTLLNDFKPVGQYQVNWDGRDNAGQLVSGGIYFYKLQVEDFIQTRKMVLLK